MKIIKDNAVYVQVCDIAFINETNIPMPSSIFNIAFGSNIAIIDESNQFEFVKFNKNYIDYFKNLDFILDLFEIARLSEEELILLGKDIRLEINKFKKMYNENKNKNKYLRDINLLEYKFESLGYMLNFNRGKILINIPNEVLEINKNKRRSLKK